MSEQSGYTISDQYATYFLTFTVVGWVDLFTRKVCKDIIISSFDYCQKSKGLLVHAYVIMESHVHLIVTASKQSSGLSNIVRDMKKYTSNRLIEWIFQSGKESRRNWLKMVLTYHAKFNTNNSKYQIWQQYNKPKVCLFPKFTNQKIDYIHRNPVVAGIVDTPEDYVYSSARNYVNRSDFILDVHVIDFGVQEGFVIT